MQVPLVFSPRWNEFIWAFTMKEIKARYKKAVLGFLWIFLNPLLQMAVIGFIFQFFIPVKVDNYFLFLFAGLLPWNMFSYSVTKCTSSIVNERGLIKKSSFPREAIVLSIVFSNVVHMLIAWGLLIVFLILDKIIDGYTFIQLFTYTARLSLTIPLIAWLTLLTVAFSLLFAALNVKYRDVNFFVQAAIPLWFYATPIVYTADMLPTHFERLLYLNPLTGVLQLFQVVVLNQGLRFPELIFMNGAMAVFLGVVSWWYFMREAKFFDDWV